MSKESMSQHEVRKYLPAFADGELDVELNLKVLEQMAMDPTNTRRVMHQQQLRKACAAAMCKPEYCCPAPLKANIASLVCESTDDAPPLAAPLLTDDNALPYRKSQAAHDGVLARIGHWAPAAVAAVLLIGALAVFFTPRTGIETAGVLVSDQQLELFGRRHSTCSSDLGKLVSNIPSPTNIAALPGTIDDYFGDTAGQIDSALDLSVLGYTYEQVGTCSVPGRRSVHVVYKAAPDSGRTGSISLWIKPDTGKAPITPGVLHTAETPSGNPVLLWKRDGRVYYLVGDARDDAQQAAQMLASSQLAGQ